MAKAPPKKRIAAKRRPAKKSASKKSPSKSSQNKTPTKKRGSKKTPSKVAPKKAVPKKVVAKAKKRLTDNDKLKIRKGLDRYKEKASAYQKNPSKLGKLFEEARAKISTTPVDPFKEYYPYLLAMIRIIRAYWKKEYREIPWKSMVMIIAAVVYFVTPTDLIPDYIPFIGYLDDAYVLSFVLRAVKKDLDNFMAWESTK